MYDWNDCFSIDFFSGEDESNEGFSDEDEDESDYLRKFLAINDSGDDYLRDCWRNDLSRKIDFFCTERSRNDDSRDLRDSRDDLCDDVCHE